MARTGPAGDDVTMEHFGKIIYFVSCQLVALVLLGCGHPEATVRPDSGTGSMAAAPGDRALPAPFKATADDIARHNRGVALMGQFEFEGARRIFDQLAREHPQWLAPRIDLAIAILNRQQAGDAERAEEILNRVLDEGTDDLRVRYCRGILKLYRGDPTSALEDFRHVIELDPSDAYAHYFAGRCFFAASQYDEAERMFAGARQLDPYLRSAYYGAMQAAQRLKKNEAARQFLDEFQRLAANPQARLADIKYTRMGPKAEVRALDLGRPVSPGTRRVGPLFALRQPLAAAVPQTVSWRPEPSDAHPLPSITVCDVNGDQRMDVFIASAQLGPENPLNAVLIADNQGDVLRVASDHPLAGIDAVEATLWGDYDNDGLTDAYFCRRGVNQLWRQAAKGQWQDVTESTQTGGGPLRTVDGAFLDVDHDGDLDLFLVQADGPNELLSNNLDGTFRPLAETAGIAGTAVHSIAVMAVDLDADRDRDLIVINSSDQHDVFLNERLWAYQRAPGFDKFRETPIEAAVAADLDADGQVEIVSLSEGKLLRWAPDESGVWSSQLLTAHPARTASHGPRHLALADIDGDGSPEAVVSSSGACQVYSLAGRGNPAIFEADGPGGATWSVGLLDPVRGPSLIGFQWAEGPFVFPPGDGRDAYLVIQLTGRDNRAEQMRSNQSGIGVQGAARIGRGWVAFDTFPSDTTPGQHLQPVALGLGGAKQVDFLRIHWPDGIMQTEVDLTADRLHHVPETQRQLSSCPVVFLWDGEQYQFVTDVLGVGGIGFNLSNGEYPPPRPWENLLLPAGLLRARSDRLSIKIGEPMEEVCYLDAAKLVAYDLPPGWGMTLDERFATSLPEPTGEALFYRREMLPTKVVSDRSQDVTKLLQAVDQQAAPPGEKDPRFIGRTQQHSIELWFDRPLDNLLVAPKDGQKGRLALVFNGWIEYPYSQTMFAAWQAGADYRSPTLEARNAEGQWQIVLKQFGYMAGMPREAAVPMERLPDGCQALRLTTNCEIYWDHVKVVGTGTCPDAIRRELDLHAAIVADVGFARRTTRADRLPDYDYQRRSPFWDTRHAAGFYTSFGTATPLIERLDDAVAIIGPGEEIQLDFHTPDQPPPSGWTRRYVLQTYGWCKDMDLFTQHGESVAPLPLRNWPGGTSNPGATQRQLLHDQFNRRYRDGP